MPESEQIKRKTNKIIIAILAWSECEQERMTFGFGVQVILRLPGSNRVVNAQPIQMHARKRIRIGTSHF